jgi:adenylate cyclase
MSGFLWELRRWKVYRVAAAYIVAARFLIQIASAVFPAWELPSRSLRLMIALILAGFPIALIFAWAFDVAPSGIERTPTTAATIPRSPSFGRQPDCDISVMRVSA